MDSEVKQLWIDALRSGKYKQGLGKLRDSNNFCCLGVLCDLYDPDLWGLGGTYYSHITHLVSFVAIWAELESINPSVIVDDEIISLHPDTLPPYTESGDYITLSQLNDSQYTFEEIATIIEKKL